MERQKFSPVLLCQSLHNKVCLNQNRTEFFKTVLAINFPILVLWWCDKGKNMYRIPCIPITSSLVVPLKELSKLKNIE